jgi:hypothetical protein
LSADGKSVILTVKNKKTEPILPRFVVKEDKFGMVKVVHGCRVQDFNAGHDESRIRPLWDRKYGAKAQRYENNPWVWIYTFKTSKE